MMNGRMETQPGRKKVRARRGKDPKTKPNVSKGTLLNYFKTKPRIFETGKRSAMDMHDDVEVQAEPNGKDMEGGDDGRIFASKKMRMMEIRNPEDLQMGPQSTTQTRQQIGEHSDSSQWKLPSKKGDSGKLKKIGVKNSHGNWRDGKNHT